MGPISSDATEGEVETQIILPLLTRSDLLSIPLGAVKSKTGIAARDIGKGAKRKVGYVPDFFVYMKAVPLLVIEAKSPSNDVHTAFSEARLYALEINRSFPPNVNPCSRILATNGVTLLAGTWDAEPLLSCSISNILPGSAELDRLKGTSINDVFGARLIAVSS